MELSQYRYWRFWIKPTTLFNLKVTRISVPSLLLTRKHNISSARWPYSSLTCVRKNELPNLMRSLSKACKEQQISKRERTSKRKMLEHGPRRICFGWISMLILSAQLTAFRVCVCLCVCFYLVSVFLLLNRALSRIYGGLVCSFSVGDFTLCYARSFSLLIDGENSTPVKTDCGWRDSWLSVAFYPFIGCDPKHELNGDASVHMLC